MSEAALTIVKDWPRVDAATLKALENVTSSQLSDAMGGSGALDRTITRLGGGGARIIGSALTVWTAPGDNLAPYAALAVARPGDVLVLACDRHDGCALLGDTIGNHGGNCPRRPGGGALELRPQCIGDRPGEIGHRRPIALPVDRHGDR